jgi:hypothetical protein
MWTVPAIGLRDPDYAQRLGRHQLEGKQTKFLSKTICSTVLEPLVLTLAVFLDGTEAMQAALEAFLSTAEEDEAGALHFTTVGPCRDLISAARFASVSIAARSSPAAHGSRPPASSLTEAFAAADRICAPVGSPDPLLRLAFLLQRVPDALDTLQALRTAIVPLSKDSSVDLHSDLVEIVTRLRHLQAFSQTTLLSTTLSAVRILLATYMHRQREAFSRLYP